MRFALAPFLLSGCLIVSAEDPPRPPGPYPGYAATWPDVRDVVWLEAFASNWPEIKEGEAARARGITDGDLFMLLYLARYAHRPLADVLPHYKGDMQALVNELRYPYLQIVVPTDGPVPAQFAGAYRMQREHEPGALTNAEFTDLVQLRLAVDYFGLSPQEAFAAGRDWQALFMRSVPRAGEGRRTMEGRAVQFGPRPWDLSTRDQFLRARGS